MAKPRVQVVGLEALEHNFKHLLELDKGEGAKAARAALRAGAKAIADDAKVRVPRDEGDLMRAIRVATTKDEKGVPVAGIRIKAARGQKQPFWWRFVEYGTGPRFRRRRRQGKVVKKLGAPTGTMPARPFIRPAYEAKKNEAVQKVRMVLARHIQKRLKKLKR